jgi:glycerophosphoryl diester phosphodiesterase
MQVFGHRGSPGYPRFAENTRASFQKALEAGAVGFELDTRLSADGTIVVIHDAALERTTNSAGCVSQFTYEQLLKLDAGNGQTIPRLSDVLDQFGGRCTIQIELKEAGIADRVAKMVVERQLASQVIVLAFDGDDVDEDSSSSWQDLRNIAATVPTGLLITSRKLRRIGARALIAAARKQDAAALHVPRDIASEDLIRLAAASSLPVRVWTVNDPAEALRFRDIGAESICSDVPAVCLQALSQ